MKQILTMFVLMSLAACTSGKVAGVLPATAAVKVLATETPLPDIPKGALTKSQVEKIFLLDAAAIKSCNIDKRKLFEAGWPNK